MTIHAEFDDLVGRRVRQIEDAYLQQDLMRPHWNDKAATSGPVLYAIGADVAHLYAAPSENAVRSDQERAIGYGEIFRDDDPRVKKAIAAVLARYIFFGLQPHTPLLILPPVARQLQVAVAVLGDQVQEQKTIAFSQTRIMAALTRGGNIPTREEVETLQLACLVTGPMAKLQRLGELFETKRVLNLAKGDPASLTGATFQRALAAVRPEEKSDFNARTQDLTDLLQSVGRKAKLNAVAAAETMAWVELINRRLAGRGRLLLITGDTAMARVGRRSPDRPGEETFTDAYIRHPRAYIDEPGALRSAQADSNATEPSLADTLTLMTGHFTDFPLPITKGAARRVLDPSVLNRIEYLQKNEPKWLENAQRGWEDLAEKALGQLGPDSCIDVLTHAAKADPEKVRELLAAFTQGVQQDYLKAFDEFFDRVVVNRIGLEFPGRAPARERPSLCFEQTEHGITKLFATADDCWNKNVPLHLDEYLAFRREILQGPGGQYFMNVANAWLLASQGHWRSATILANRAYAYRETDAGDIASANGREAAYLLAACWRYGADSLEDLETARKFLRQFGVIADQEQIVSKKQIVSKDSYNDLDIVREREGSEEIALNFTGMWFEYFGSTVNRVRIIDNLFEETVHIRQSFIPTTTVNMEAARQRAANAKSASQHAYFEHIDNVRKQLIRAAWRHVISFELSCGLSDGPDRLQKVWDTVRELRANKTLPVPVWRSAPAEDAPGTIARSGYGELQDICCTTIFGQSSQQRANAIEELRKLRAVLEAAEARPSMTKATTCDHEQFDLTRLCAYSFDRRRFIGWIDMAARAARSYRT